MTMRRPLDNLDDDIRDHIERETMENVERGMPSHDARLAARRRFGSPLRVMESARAVWVPRWFDSLRLDIRHTRRSLLQSPGYLLAGVLTFALTLGSNAAIFGAIHAVLLNPLPIRNPEGLVVGWETNTIRGQTVVEISYQDFEAWRSAASTLADVAAFGSSVWPLTIEDRIDPVRMASVGVSSNFFDTLGAAPLWGRFFRPDDDRPGGLRPLVLSHRFWRARFGGDPAVIGKTIETGDGTAEIVGVAPIDLDFPRGVDVWLPVVPVLSGVEGIDGLRDVGVLFTVARLNEGLSLAAAEASLQRIAESSTRAGSRLGAGVQLKPFLDHYLGPVRGALWWLWAAVALLLLIACGNLAGLILARAICHRREYALRVALGAATAALWRMVILESMAIAVPGGIAGIVTARWLLAGIVTLAPDDVPRLAGATVNLTVVGFTFVLVLLATLAAASVPMLETRRLALVANLQEGARTIIGTSVKTRAWLVGVQVAISVLLLTAAGLLLRSYLNARHLNLGFVPEHVVTLEVDSRRGGAAHNEWARELLARLEHIPGIEAAAAAHARPLALGAIGTDSTLVIEGQPNARSSARLNPLLNYNAVTAEYFSAMRIDLIEGRLFTGADTSVSSRVVIVSEGTARTLWPGKEPIGQRLSLLALSEGDPSETWRAVIGVVDDVRYRGLDDVRLDIYEPAAQSTARAGYVVVRSTRDALAVASAVQAEARRIEPRALFNGVTTMEAVVDRATATWTLSAWLFGLFALAAVVLVCVGLFSVLTLDVSQRTREFALRIALGARAADIAQRAVATIGAYVLAGTACGLVLAILSSRFLAGLLFQVHPLDTTTFAIAICVVALTAAAGSLWPIYNVIRINPVAELRRSE